MAFTQWCFMSWTVLSILLDSFYCPVDALKGHLDSCGLWLTLSHNLPCPFREPRVTEPRPLSRAQFFGTKEKPQDPLE